MIIRSSAQRCKLSSRPFAHTFRRRGDAVFPWRVRARSTLFSRSTARGARRRINHRCSAERQFKAHTKSASRAPERSYFRTDQPFRFVALSQCTCVLFPASLYVALTSYSLRDYFAGCETGFGSQIYRRGRTSMMDLIVETVQWD